MKPVVWIRKKQPSTWRSASHPPLGIGKIHAAKLYRGVEVETILDPNIQPFLFDHQLEGVPLLPGVMGVEIFAELASVLAPNYHVAAVEQVEYQRPFKFHRMQPQTLYLNATVRPSGDGELTAHTVLKSVTTFPRGEMPRQEKVHFTANVCLTRATVETPPLTPNPSPLMGEGQGERVEGCDIYRIYFHGPAYQVLERVQVDNVKAFGLMSASLPPDTNPADAASVMAPRLIELCFQTAGIWELKHQGVLALPLAIRLVSVYRRPEQARGARLYALVDAIDDGAAFNAQVLDENGALYVTLQGYRTVRIK